MSLRSQVATLALLASTTGLSARAPAQTSPQPYVVRNVRLSDAADAPKKSLVLRAGRIEKLLDEGAELPPGARIVDGNGALVLPAFIDGYSFAGLVTPSPLAAQDVAPKPNADVLVDMRDANRKGIEPAFRAAQAFKSDAETDKRQRSSGFGAWLAAPHGELLSGTSALVSSREAAPRDRMRKAAVFQHGAFVASGPGYPGTLMGAIAQLRQFFLDTQWGRELERRTIEGKPGRRAPYDEDFLAVSALLAKQTRLLCEAESAADIERWIALGDEFGFQIAIAGGREAWRRTDVLKARGIPVFLTLQWGEEAVDPHAKEKEKEKEKEKKPEAKPKPDEKAPDDAPKKDKDSAAEDDKKQWLYEEPLRVREEKRRLWEEKRDCALRLNEAGVEFAFGTGKDSPKELLERVRTLVEKGLPKDVALRALTSGAAGLLGVGTGLGRIEPGFDATLALWSKNPLLDKDAKLVWLFVDGYAYEFELDSNELKGKPDEGIDAAGAWTFEFEGAEAKPASGELTMSPAGAVKGTLHFKSPFDDSEVDGTCAGQVAGKKIRLTGHVKVSSFESEVTLEGELERDSWTGSVTWKWSGGETTSKFKATRKPKREGGL